MVSPQTKATAAFQAHTAAREVERGDDADDAQRVPRLHQAVARALGRHRAPIELARQPDREVADVDGLLHLAEGLRADLPGLDRDQLGDVRLVFTQQLAQTLDERAPDRRGYDTPLTKSTAGRGDCLLHLRPACGGDIEQRLARDRRTRAHGRSSPGRGKIDTAVLEGPPGPRTKVVGR